MNKRLKPAIFIILCAIAIFLSGCKGCNYQGYDGEHPELYTEAVYSILGANGYYDSHSLADPDIEILETDEYGRKLFFYRERGLFALCIMQKTDNNFVYYYPDFNFITTTKYVCSENINEVIEKSFAPEAVNNLKTLNDYNKEFNESKCIKTAITNLKSSPALNKNIKKQLDSVCKDYAKEYGCKGEDTVYRYAQFSSFDDYGRMLYYIYGIHRGLGPDSESKEFEWAIIFNPDWSFNADNSLLLLTDNYQNDLKDFKELNNWNKPLKGETK